MSLDAKVARKSRKPHKPKSLRRHQSAHINGNGQAQILWRKASSAVKPVNQKKLPSRGCLTGGRSATKSASAEGTSDSHPEISRRRRRERAQPQGATWHPFGPRRLARRSSERRQSCQKESSHVPRMPEGSVIARKNRAASHVCQRGSVIARKNREPKPLPSPTNQRNAGEGMGRRVRRIKSKKHQTSWWAVFKDHAWWGVGFQWVQDRQHQGFWGSGVIMDRECEGKGQFSWLVVVMRSWPDPPPPP